MEHRSPIATRNKQIRAAIRIAMGVDDPYRHKDLFSVNYVRNEQIEGVWQFKDRVSAEVRERATYVLYTRLKLKEG